MSTLDKKSVLGIAALLVHAAKIDEIYSEKERNLIKNFIISYLKEADAEAILSESEKIEGDSNQLLNFTKIIKDKSLEIKKDIL